MNAEEQAKLTPILDQLLDDAPLTIRCITGFIGETKVAIVLQKAESGEINPVVLSRAQLDHINQIAKEHQL